MKMARDKEAIEINSRKLALLLITSVILLGFFLAVVLIMSGFGINKMITYLIGALLMIFIILAKLALKKT